MTRAAGWLLLAGGTAVVGVLSRSLVDASPDGAATSAGSFGDALATACGVALVLSWGWFLVATLACLADELRAPTSPDVVGAVPTRRGARRHRRASAARRLARVLAGTGLACMTAPCLPAAHALAPVDLPLPTRQLGTPSEPREDPAPPPRPRTVALPDAGSVVVGPGDTLWAIAAARLAPHASDSAVDEAWRRLYAHNRSAVGHDPDLIHPGTRLRTP